MGVGICRSVKSGRRVVMATSAATRLYGQRDSSAQRHCRRRRYLTKRLHCRAVLLSVPVRKQTDWKGRWEVSELSFRVASTFLEPKKGENPPLVADRWKGVFC
ncbi:hypothetical protein MTO96_011114 [Rhipicephalus appendiculatus]